MNKQNLNNQQQFNIYNFNTLNDLFKAFSSLSLEEKQNNYHLLEDYLSDKNITKQPKSFFYLTKSMASTIFDSYTYKFINSHIILSNYIENVLLSSKKKSHNSKGYQIGFWITVTNKNELAYPTKKVLKIVDTNIMKMSKVYTKNGDSDSLDYLLAFYRGLKDKTFPMSLKMYKSLYLKTLIKLISNNEFEYLLSVANKIKVEDDFDKEFYSSMIYALEKSFKNNKKISAIKYVFELKCILKEKIPFVSPKN